MDTLNRGDQQLAPSVQASESRAAILQFSEWMARQRILAGLLRRLMFGQRLEIRSIIEQSLQTHGVPASVADVTIGWLSSPRVIAGLARRRALAGADAVQGVVVLVLENALAVVANPPPVAAPPIPDQPGPTSRGETREFRADNCDHLLLPGVPAGYRDTPVWDPENRALLGEESAMLQLQRDRIPLPTTAAREGYFDERHLDFWLSGLVDMRKVVAATGLDRIERPRILDFGGASARVMRHFVGWKPGSELYLSDIDPWHVLLTKQMFEGALTAFHNSGLPQLPFPDDYLDVVMAFSVFTHIDADDTAWLLELRRVVKPGGYLWVTIHDQETWKILPQTVMLPMLSEFPEFQRYYTTNPELTGRVVQRTSELAHYNCQVFVGPDYIDRFWAPLFNNTTTIPLGHGHQGVLILRV